MIITNIEPLTKAKVRVYIEEQLAFVLYKGELSRYQIKVNEEISDECYREILDEVLTKRAKSRCLYLLKSMDRTEFQLRDKLKQGGYPAVVTERAIEYIKQFHYIDDRRYAQYYIEGAKTSKSRRQIVQELNKRGVSKEIIEETLEKTDPGDECQMIKKWIEKKRVDPQNADQKELNRLYGFLMRKGFSSGDIARVLRGREF